MHNGEAHISCLACATDGADHSWRLATSAPAPASAELSEELYDELVRGRTQRTVSAAGQS